MASLKKQIEASYAHIRSSISPPEGKSLASEFVAEMWKRQEYLKEADTDNYKKLGVGFTPLPIVDYIVRSTIDACWNENGVPFGDDSVEYLDPFCGTGIFLWWTLLVGAEDGGYLIPAESIRRKLEIGKFIGIEINHDSLVIAKRHVERALELRLGEPADWDHAICTDTLLLPPTVDLVALVADNENLRCEHGLVVFPSG